MYFVLIFCVLLIFDPVGRLVYVWGDWYHEDKGVRSVGCHALFPPSTNPPKFSHLIPCTTVTARQEGSSPTHCSDRQLTLTIMPLLLMLTRAHPFSFHWEGRKRESERDWGREVGRESAEVRKRGRLTGIQTRKKDPFFELQTVCHCDANSSETPYICCVGRLSDTCTHANTDYINQACTYVSNLYAW